MDFSKHEQCVYYGDFSNDGRFIFTVSTDHVIKLWDLKGHVLAELNSNKANISAVQFSPNGKYIVTTSLEGNAKRWPTPQTIYNYLKQKHPPLHPLTEKELIKYGIKQD